MEEVLTEEEKEVIEAEEVRKAGIFFSPEGVIMMVTAFLVDGGELIVEHIPYAGQVLSI